MGSAEKNLGILWGYYCGKNLGICQICQFFSTKQLDMIADFSISGLGVPLPGSHHGRGKMSPEVSIMELEEMTILATGFPAFQSLGMVPSGKLTVRY